MGFAVPYGLVSLAFVALLVLLHLRRRQQRELDVSSLLLWDAVHDEPPRGRFPIIRHRELTSIDEEAA